MLVSVARMTAVCQCPAQKIERDSNFERKPSSLQPNGVNLCGAFY